MKLLLLSLVVLSLPLAARANSPDQSPPTLQNGLEQNAPAGEAQLVGTADYVVITYEAEAEGNRYPIVPTTTPPLSLDSD
jgi:hypothetical protein